MNRAVLIALLSLANEATDEQITEKIKVLAKSDADLAGAKTALENERNAHGATKTNLETSLANTRKKLAETAVDAAIKAGRVTLANREQWITDLVNDYDGKSVALANTKPTLKTEARTSGSRREALANSDSIRERSDKVLALVNEKQKQGKSYDQAFKEAQTELAPLFNEMQTPEKEKE